MALICNDKHGAIIISVAELNEVGLNTQTRLKAHISNR